MTQAPLAQAIGVEQAFHDLEAAPPVLQGLLRPVLIRALQDTVLMRLLGAAALSQHLALLGQVLTHPVPDQVDAPLPPFEAFVHLAGGADIEDVEDAYAFAGGLDASLRTRVEGGLSRVLQHEATRSGQGTISLLALARLFALAFSNLPFVAHVLESGAVQAFLPRGAAKPRTQAQIEPLVKAADQGSTPELASFVGQLVELVATVNEDEASRSGHVFVTIGRVLEVAAGHVVLQTLREGDEHASEVPGSKLLIGMTHIVTMRTLSQDSLVDRSSKAG